MKIYLYAMCLRRLLVLVVLSCAILGCDRSARSLSLNQPRAREACNEFLTAWKNGKQVADLKPKIIGRDSDWETGKKLESFEILKDERSDGPNLHLTVRQTLKDATGKEIQQEVAYVVGTSPVVTVFRSDE